MSSVLNVDTIADKAGTGPVALTKQSAAKVFAQINGTGTITTDINLNVASLTDDGVGEPWVNVINSFSSANSYACTAATEPNAGWNDTVTWNTAGGASQVRLFTGSGGTLIDLNPVGIAVFGDLA